MHDLIEKLRFFDRKERFAVLREVLGFHPEFPSLDCGFRRRLMECIGIKVPESCFLAMDYHLDWIELAIYWAKHPSIQPGRRFPTPDCAINKSQQDIDLLIAFQELGANKIKTHLVMIEAKAYSSWNNKQLESKTARLRKIMEKVQMPDELQPHFVLMTRAESKRVDCTDWKWLKYNLPERYKITRCDEDGVSSKEGGHLMLHRVPSKYGVENRTQR
ncbi:MAG: hypothetical protein OXC53_03325 [Rhodobacteraceae bacterium]|nr:hypothetical protein [Gammaproteobacteria bacterium]MCY4326605.1 hypothetical protein [Paracoccaceae bacterium]